MTDVFVSGANVSFPFEPYPCQITYMEKVLACLKDVSMLLVLFGVEQNA